MDNLGERIAVAAKKIGGIDALAKLTGIPRTTLYGYVRGGSEPKVSSLIEIAQHTGVDTGWLAEGKQEPTEIKRPNIVPGFSTSRSIELVGMASCGVTGWQRPIQRHTRTQSIAGLSDEAFATITFGDSLVPMGISDAMICYCDPAYDLVPGDIVYLERNDNTASLKRFEELLTIGGHPAMSVVGWQENEDKADHSDSFTDIDLLRPGRFEEYRLDIDMTNLKRFAPVIYVRRRL